MAKARKKAKKKVAAKGKKKAKTRKPAAKRKKPAAKRKKPAAKPKRRVAPAKKQPAAGEAARLKQEVQRWKDLHAQLQEQIRAKDSTIAMQMQEIMELKKNLEQLTSPTQ